MNEKYNANITGQTEFTFVATGEPNDVEFTINLNGSFSIFLRYLTRKMFVQWFVVR